jgi:hypothetical protein
MEAVQMRNRNSWKGAHGDTLELWAMGAIALVVFYSNYMVAPLSPAFSREFAVLPNRLGSPDK